MSLRYLGGYISSAYNPLAANVGPGTNVAQTQGVFTTQAAFESVAANQWCTDPNFKNTTLLLQADNAANALQNNTFLDSSTNNFTMTRYGNTTQGSFSPYSQPNGYWSNYFDGTSDFLNIPSSANLAPGSVFTFEAWVYLPINAVANMAIYGTLTVGEFQVGYETISNWGIKAGNGSWLLTTTTLPIVNQWNHVVVSRGGLGANQTSLFLNGVRVANGTVSNAFSTTSAYQIGFDGGTGATWNGYISNLRLTKGGDIYGYTNTTITVPTAPLTTTVPSGTVQLLTCRSNRFLDNSANNFALTVSGNGLSSQPFIPFTPQYAYAPIITGGSSSFDGTGDYLTVPGNSVFSLGTGNFTVEAWLYQTATNTYPGVLEIGVHTVNGILFIASNGSTITAYSSMGFMGTATAPPLNTWNHIAWVRNAGTFKIYVNGIGNAGVASSNNISDFSVITFGGESTRANATYTYSGRMSNLRVVNGTAVYTANFTPPTAPVTAITNTQLLTNFTNAGIVDGSQKNNLETIGNVQVSTSVKKFGSGSIFLNPTYSTGPTGYLFQASSNATTFGLGNFTVEFWCNWITTASRQDLFWWQGTKVAGILWNITAGSVSYYIDGVAINAPLTPTPGVWYHIALSRSAGVTKLFINGIQGGISFADVKDYSGLYNLYSGRDQGASSNWANCYIDDFRITRGIARYVNNFTPPQIAFAKQ